MATVYSPAKVQLVDGLTRKYKTFGTVKHREHKGAQIIVEFVTDAPIDRQIAQQLVEREITPEWELRGLWKEYAVLRDRHE